MICAALVLVLLSVGPGKLGDFDLTPHLEYAMPTGTKVRPPQAPLQLGAFAARAERKTQ